MHRENRPCVTERSNDAETRIGGASVRNAEKAGRKADSVQSLGNRQCYETEEEKRKFIRESFQLDSNAILNEDAKLKEEVIKLFLDNFEVLAKHPCQYGETDVLEMKIDLIPGAVLYKSRVRLLNSDQKGNLRDQMDEWSPWASPLIPVKKKDGRTRWVTDLRELNKQTVKDSYPLTNIQEILHSLQGATVFSSLDACGAYHAVRIEPGSYACTAFISPFGTFQYIRMPFWLANAGNVYSRMLDTAMKDLGGTFIGFGGYY